MTAVSERPNTLGIAVRNTVIGAGAGALLMARPGNGLESMKNGAFIAGGAALGGALGGAATDSLLGGMIGGAIGGLAGGYLIPPMGPLPREARLAAGLLGAMVGGVSAMSTIDR